MRKKKQEEPLPVIEDVDLPEPEDDQAEDIPHPSRWPDEKSET